MPFLSRRIHLITGKGGVGRTTVAVALAQALAQAGRRVLLTEIEEVDAGPSVVGARIGQPEIGAKPKKVAPNLHCCVLRAGVGHEDFLRSVLPAGPLIRAALRSKALSRFLVAAP